MSGDILRDPEEAVNEMADEYRRLLTEEDELDEFFVAEDMGGQLESGELEPDMAQKVLKKLGIDKPIEDQPGI